MERVVAEIARHPGFVRSCRGRSSSPNCASVSAVRAIFTSCRNEGHRGGLSGSTARGRDAGSA